MKNKFLEYVINDMVSKTQQCNPIYISFPLPSKLHIRAIHFFKEYEEYDELCMCQFMDFFTSHYGVGKGDYEYIWTEYFKGLIRKLKGW